MQSRLTARLRQSRAWRPDFALDEQCIETYTLLFGITAC
jgi:hypothetical protein